MQVSIESGEGLEKVMSVELPAEKVDVAMNKKLDDIARTVRLDGFRPGKVPKRVIKQKFGVQARQEVYGDLIQESYYEAVKAEDLKPAGEPKIDLNDESGEGGFGYTATFDVMPEIKLADLSSSTVTKTVAQVQGSDVEDMINNLRKQRTEWTDVDRAAAIDDTVTIDFKGTKDGEAFDGGSADNVPLVLGSGSMIEGFESGLVGASAGDTRTLDVKFPDDYRATTLAGQDVTFEVTVNKVSEATLPEITEDFIKQFGIDDGLEATWRTEIRSNMERELKKKVEASLKDAVMDAILEANDLTVPAALITDEAGRMKQQAIADMKQNGQAAPTMDLPASIFEEQAKKRVALGLIVAVIIKEQNLQVDQEKVTEMIDEIAGTYDEPEQVINFYNTDKNQRGSLESLVLENQVVDWVVSQLKVEEETKTFSDVMDAKAVA